MPLKRTYSTTSEIVPTGGQFKRKKYPKRRRIRMYPANGTVGKPRPFPTRMVATLRYVETVGITNSVTGVSSYNIACNSIYDPNLSGTGHQPYGHDTYATIYNQYTVLMSKIKIKPNLGTSTAGLTWGLGIEDTVTSTTAADTWMERPTYINRKMCTAYSPDAKELSLTWLRAKRFPREDLYRNLSAPFGANPSELEVFNIVLQSYNAAALGTIYFTVEVEYTVEMYELQALASS